MTLRLSAVLAPLALGAALLTGCRGMVSEKPPIHPNLNMDFQEKFEPQEANPFFADGRANRTPVAGTVARGLMPENTPFQTGREAGGALVRTNPLPTTRDVLLRGQNRYNIYCAVCHGKAGDAKGVVMTGGYGWVAPSYHDDRLRAAEDGHFFEVASNGWNTMPGYAAQIPVADRWAIVAYIRALQKSQNAQRGDLPADVIAQVEQGASANMAGGNRAASPASAPAADSTR
ncbi:MAG: cytochrome c [Rhodothermales bacterium]|nr:cytochrome c [Rhodothermales bacterium]